MWPVNRSTRTVGAGLGQHQVEQIVSSVKAPLRLDRLLEAELFGDVRKGPLEVRRQLAGVASGRATRDTVTFDEQDIAGRCAQGEERGGDACDSRPDHDDVGGRIGLERPGRPVVSELGDPWGSAWLI